MKDNDDMDQRRVKIDRQVDLLLRKVKQKVKTSFEPSIGYVDRILDGVFRLVKNDKNARWTVFDKDTNDIICVSHDPHLLMQSLVGILWTTRRDLRESLGRERSLESLRESFSLERSKDQEMITRLRNVINQSARNLGGNVDGASLDFLDLVPGEVAALKVKADAYDKLFSELSRTLRDDVDAT